MEKLIKICFYLAGQLAKWKLNVNVDEKLKPEKYPNIFSTFNWFTLNIFIAKRLSE